MPDCLASADIAVFQFINQELANPVFDLVMPVLRERLTWIPVYILLGLYTIRRDGKRGWVYVSFLVLVFALSDSLTYYLIKPYVHRLRPCHEPWLHARLVLGHCGGKWSFPSSHATNHMALSTGIILCGIFRNRAMNMLILLWALVVGFAQVYVGVHYPADVLAGWLWGAALAGILFYLCKKGEEKIWGG